MTESGSATPVLDPFQFCVDPEHFEAPIEYVKFYSPFKEFLDI